MEPFKIHVHTVHDIKMVCELQVSHIGTLIHIKNTVIIKKILYICIIECRVQRNNEVVNKGSKS